jgi:nitroreductase
MRRTLLRLAPFRAGLAILDYVYDFWRWALHAGCLYNSTHDSVQGEFRKRYDRHKVEKRSLLEIGADGLSNGLRSVAAPEPCSKTFERLVHERHSVRTYSGAAISDDTIVRSVRLAIQSPSACNRQAVRVHVFSGPQCLARILRHQNGNRGFGSRADKLLLITYDLRALLSSAERNLPYLDGGLFAMTLIYALQDAGVATCCLNVNHHSFREAALRRALRIPPQEAPILLIAAGGFPATFRVPASERLTTEAVLQFH